MQKTLEFTKKIIKESALQNPKMDKHVNGECEERQTGRKEGC